MNILIRVDGKPGGGILHKGKLYVYSFRTTMITTVNLRQEGAYGRHCGSGATTREIIKKRYKIVLPDELT